MGGAGGSRLVARTAFGCSAQSRGLIVNADKGGKGSAIRAGFGCRAEPAGTLRARNHGDSLGSKRFLLRASARLLAARWLV